jgi:Zn-dependent peptidase ImmA (M78 family)
MTHDALSRAVNGQRHFSAVELASIANVLKVDTHWLITGKEDPFKVRLAARHLWDQSSHEQQENDDQIIRRVVDAYHTAFADVGRVASSMTPLPEDPVRLRTLLSAGVEAGEDIRYLADQIQATLLVDIVRDPGLQTDYSFRIGEHAVILLKSTVAWFRANWSIAHELGHLALGHHISDRTNASDEGSANRFAADFLLPIDLMQDIDWAHMSKPAFTLWLWNAGVSTQVMRNRFKELNLDISDDVEAAIQLTTPKLMRAHVDAIRSIVHSHSDPIWERENATTGRQFPEYVVAALTERVEAGQADPHVLAWVREVPVDDLDWPGPDTDNPSVAYQDLASHAEATDWFHLDEAR